MKNVRLAATGIEIDVPENFYYHDDGQVRSLDMHTAKLQDKYGQETVKIPWHVRLAEKTPIPRTYRQWQQNNGKSFNKGRYFRHSTHPSIIETIRANGFINAHVYVLDILGDRETTFFKGHEETHLLIDLGQISVLKTALESRNIRASSLDQLPEEAICQIGGFYSTIFNYSVATYKLQGVKDETFAIWSEWLRNNSTWNLQ